MMKRNICEFLKTLLRSRVARILLLSSVATAAIGNESPAQVLSPTLKKVGDPIWKVGDIHQFSGRSNSFAAFRATLNEIFPRNEWCSPRDLPQDNLTAAAMAAAGYEDAATFLSTANDGDPNGIFLAIRLLPDPGETGSSLDSESGPILPLRLLPIRHTGGMYKEGKRLDGGSGNLGRPDCLVDGVDGLSSFQQFFGTNATFFPPGTEVVGQFEQRLSLRDSERNGWDMVLPYEIIPEVLGDLSFNGSLDAMDIDILTSAVRQSLTDSKYDINGDGQVNIDDRSYWVHDSTIANTYFGDANLDGEFNSSDLTEVLKAGEYEDNITLNSTWVEGDWDGDGDFGTSDLVAALTEGSFGQGPRAAVSAVPEPSSLAMVTLGILALTGRIRRFRIREPRDRE